MSDRYSMPPAGWWQIQWHPDPRGRIYRSMTRARRSADWLNSNEHGCDQWLYRPFRRRDGRVSMQRRWIGE